MKEIKEIVKAFDKAYKSKKKTALATVVQVEGSSYRRAGARMLVTDDGELTGAISGGCLEGDALRKALLVMAQQKPMLVTYDTTDEDDAKLGVGLGCNGIIHILIEPIDPERNNTPIHFLRSLLQTRQKAVMITLFSLESRNTPQYGTCLLLNESGVLANSELTKELEHEILADAREALSGSVSALKTYYTDRYSTAFIELIKPVISLNILGAGNDAIPLVQMASIMGWEITVFDGRPNYPTWKRFPQASRTLVAKPEQVLSQVQPDDRTVFVIMTHNYNYDLAILRQILTLDIQYIGVLGPKSKLNRMLEELRIEGLQITPQQMEKIYGPAGLEIGSETAEEIALAIISEINSVMNNKSGGYLREKEGPIHAGVNRSN